MGLIDALVEAQIRAAEARGEFDNLPGAGKPIPDLDKPYAEMWGARKLLAREGINLAAEMRSEGIDAKRVAALEHIDERRRG